MKKFIVVLLLLAATSAMAYGMLARQEVRGFKRYCYYNDGTILTVQAYELCPLNVK